MAERHDSTGAQAESCDLAGAQAESLEPAGAQAESCDLAGGQASSLEPAGEPQERRASSSPAPCSRAACSTTVWRNVSPGGLWPVTLGPAAEDSSPAPPALSRLAAAGVAGERTEGGLPGEALASPVAAERPDAGVPTDGNRLGHCDGGDRVAGAVGRGGLGGLSITLP
mmetsp:Transcript_5764/g.17878  ORF Transcript_5764/g.17878 Transcript_5764/m.17878 type:complete len:169 (+) Transcript_5764:185-691(+)